MAEPRFIDLDAADAALDRVLDVQRRMDALAAERAVAITEFERAFDAAYPPGQGPLRERARAAELACALRMPERTAQSLVAESRTLVNDLPATLAALGEGRFSYRHAQVIVDQLGGLPAEEREPLEREALSRAEKLTVGKFRERVRKARERRAPETAAKRHRDALADRGVWLEASDDGMAYLTARLGAVEGQAIFARLSAAARSADDDRTIDQRRADLLADVLLGREVRDPASPLGRFRGIVPTVLVSVPVLSLLGKSCTTATVEGIGPIDAETARELTSEAPSLYRLLTDPHSGAPVAASPENYRIPEALRLWLRLRDGTCRFPGCAIATRHSDLDHTHDWVLGGRTLDDNLAHLSRGHHTLKHSGGWKVHQPKPGVLVWTSYLGRRYQTEPQDDPPPDLSHEHGLGGAPPEVAA